MRKKWMALLTSSVMAVSVLSGCGTSESSETTKASESSVENETDTVSAESTGSSYDEQKVLRVAMECAYAPFNWTQETEELANGDTAYKITNSEGYAYGYDVKVAKMLADYLGWDLEIYKTEWTAITSGLNAGDYDCIIGGMIYTEERDESLDFTTAYYLRDVCMTVAADGPYADFTDLSQFEGMNVTVTTQLGTNFPHFFSQIPDYVEVPSYETTSEGFMAVQTGTADIMLMDVPTAKSAVNTMSGLKILDIELEVPEGDSNDCVIATREGDELRDILQEALNACGWIPDNKDQYDAQMDEMIALQPGAN